MTMAVPGGSDVDTFDTDYGNVGLEDVGQSDVIIPRLRIVHDEGVFENNLSKQRFEKMKVILLGLVKQRIMWNKTVEDGDVPQCKSPDFEHGFPNMSDEGRKETRFPWALSNYDIAAARPVVIPPKTNQTHPEGWSSNGHGVLPCASCRFAQWGADSTPPLCSEQHTYPLLYCVGEGTEHEDWLPALYTIQKTGIKPSRQYISSFAQTRTPMFTVYTEIGLNLSTRGSVKYSIPTFRRLEATPSADWTHFGDQLRGIRSFIRQAPRPVDDYAEGGSASVSNKNTPPEATAEAAPAAAPAAAAAPKVAAPEPSTDDDLPF